MNAFDKLNSETIFKPDGEVNAFANAVADKDYNKLQRNWNVSSYSILQVLHACPRKMLLTKSRAAAGAPNINNVDFSFGHAVGAGIQSWLLTRDIDIALFNSCLAWKLPYDEVNEKKKKSLWEACLAVIKYVEFFSEHMDEWEVYVMPNGKPAVELAFEVDFENGFKHYGHVDVVMKNIHTGEVAVFENKTHGFKSIDEAIYANSSQGVSYAVIVDAISDAAKYTVYYQAYSAPSREWEVLPFSKTVEKKIEWIKDVTLDHASIATYRKMNFYPKRGESCMMFNRRCQFFGDCDLVAGLPDMQTLEADESAEDVDFKFTVSQLVNSQQKDL